MAAKELNCTILPSVSPMNDITIFLLVGLNVITSISSIVINSCFIVGIASNRSLMTPTNLLVGSLSLSDFLVGLIAQPLFSAHLLVNRHEMRNCMLAYCSFVVLGVFCGASGLCLPIISLDRCIRMAKLSFYRSYVTRTRVIGALCFVWANAVCLAFVPFYGIPKVVFYAMLIAYLGIIVVIMTTSYIYVVRKSKRKLTRVGPRSDENNSRDGPSDSTGKSQTANEISRQMQVTVTVTYLISVVITSWLPGFVASLIWAMGLPLSDDSNAIVTSHYVLITFGFMASTINPLLYCWRIRDVRKATLEIIRKVLRCS